MSMQRLIAWVLLSAVLAPMPALADSYVFDKQHTFVRFTWNHLGLSHQSGRIADVDGKMSFDADHPEAATVEVKLPMAALATGVRELDSQLKSKEYFDVASYPTAIFESTSVALTCLLYTSPSPRDS